MASWLHSNVSMNSLIILACPEAAAASIDLCTSSDSLQPSMVMTVWTMTLSRSNRSRRTRSGSPAQRPTPVWSKMYCQCIRLGGLAQASSMMRMASILSRWMATARDVPERVFAWTEAGESAINVHRRSSLLSWTKAWARHKGLGNLSSVSSHVHFVI